MTLYNDVFDYLNKKPEQNSPQGLPLPTSKQVKSINGYLGVTDEDLTPVTFSKEDILQNPEDMNAIRDMMVKSKGTEYKDLSDEEVYDTFLSHMRWVNANEVYTAKEAVDVFSADEKTRAAYGRAYQVYDKVGNLFGGGGGSVGDKLSGVKDYAAATVLSPSTYLGGIIGKFFGKAASKTAQKEFLTLTTEAIMKEATKNGVSQVAKKEVKKEILRMTAEVSAKKAVAAAFVVEASVANVQDRLYQNIMLETGAQDEWSYTQSALNTILGGAGSLIAPLFAKRKKGSSGLANVEAQIKESKIKRKANSNKVIQEEVPKAIKALNADWLALAAKGADLDANKALRDSVINWFTDYKNESGFISILQRAGADLDIETSGGFARSLVNFAEDLPADTKSVLNESFAPLGVTFDQVVLTFAASAREAGQSSNLLSSASKFYDNYKNITIANRQNAAGVVDELSDNVGKPLNPQVLGYIQSVWKRAIVSHIGTTVLNVKGWGAAMAARSAAEALQMATLYGQAGVQTLLGKNSKVTLAQARALKNNLRYMTQIAVDPFTTIEGFYKLLDQAPKKTQGAVARQFFQGVDTRGAEAFGLNPNSSVARNTEKLLDKAQALSLVNAQDLLTKSLSGIKELDKQIRLKHGLGLADLVQQGRTHEITDEAWDKAVEALQADTFSKDFSGEKSALGRLAKMSQDVSNLPGVGFFYPFGQFVNSVIAFSWRYSPLGLIEATAKMYKDPTMDMGTKVSQGFVGSVALAFAAQREEEKQKEGLQWFEEKGDSGEVYRVDNLFPIGLYNAAGRALAGVKAGEGTNKDLWIDLSRQLAAPAAIAELGKFAPVIDMVKFLTDPRTSDDDRDAVLNLISYAGETVSGIAAGFTRPLDPINDLVGAMGEVDGTIDTSAVDRKLVEDPLDRTALGLARYTDSIFSFLLGEEGPDGKRLGPPKKSATQIGSVQSGNHIAGIFGHNTQQRRTNIDRLLGMVNKAPFRVDSFTTGVPEYDNWMNEEVAPLLERESAALLKNKNFNKLPMSAKIDVVEKMIENTRNLVLDKLDGSGGNPTILDARRKLLTMPSASRKRAKISLGINKPDHKLTLLEIEMIRKAIELEKTIFKEEFRQ